LSYEPILITFVYCTNNRLSASPSQHGQQNVYSSHMSGGQIFVVFILIIAMGALYFYTKGK